jgi:hypothetical protein
MKKTLVVCSSNRGMQERTRRSVQALQAEGALFSLQEGTADVAFARNQALSWTCELLRSSATQLESGSRDLVLMVDDDMVFSVEAVGTLAEYARKTGHPASAVYCSKGGYITAARMDQPFPDGVLRWRVGLGLLAIPARLLLELERDARKFQHLGKELTEFCFTGVRGHEWIAEDYCLCERLGGVALLPVEAGHLKTVMLLPEQGTLDRIARGEALPLHVEPPRVG